MQTAVKLSAYTLGLVAIFGAAAGAGSALGPEETPRPAPPAHTEAPGAAHGETGEPHGETTDQARPATALPAGLQITQDGYRLDPISTTLTTEFSFRILGPDGDPVTTYTRDHDKDLHLIVVRRDLSGFQHVHPARSADGTWTVALSAPTPGQYRVFADFVTDGHDLVLGADLPAPGDYQPTPLPAAEHTAEVDGYTVRLDGELNAGQQSRLTFTITRDGERITPEPYLGANGHLVALRAGDLAYLHVHPAGGDALAFDAEVPSAGDYRLYLDFQHDGKVHTAEFTGGPHS